MKNLPEIERALRQLTPQEQLEIARRLLDDLQENGVSCEKGGQTAPLPDYSARRRRIFGNKVLPNMVLDGRADERW